VEFVSAVLRLRRDHPTFRRRRFFTGTEVRSGERLNDIVWLHASGQPMGDDDWQGGQVLGMYLNGDGIAGVDARGQQITDDHFLLYFNAGGELDATLPDEEYAAAWDVVIDTGGTPGDEPVAAGSTLHLESRSVVVLREHSEPEAEPDSSVAASLAAQAGA
jgi:glycogen operon protein